MGGYHVVVVMDLGHKVNIQVTVVPVVEERLPPAALRFYRGLDEPRQETSPPSEEATPGPSAQSEASSGDEEGSGDNDSTGL